MKKVLFVLLVNYKFIRCKFEPFIVHAWSCVIFLWSTYVPSYCSCLIFYDFLLKYMLVHVIKSFYLSLSISNIIGYISQSPSCPSLYDSLTISPLCFIYDLVGRHRNTFAGEDQPYRFSLLLAELAGSKWFFLFLSNPLFPKKLLLPNLRSCLFTALFSNGRESKKTSAECIIAVETRRLFFRHYSWLFYNMVRTWGF